MGSDKSTIGGVSPVRITRPRAELKYNNTRASGRVARTIQEVSPMQTTMSRTCRATKTPGGGFPTHIGYYCALLMSAKGTHQKPLQPGTVYVSHMRAHARACGVLLIGQQYPARSYVAGKRTLTRKTIATLWGVLRYAIAAGVIMGNTLGATPDHENLIICKTQTHQKNATTQQVVTHIKVDISKSNPHG